jgi:hypothetical protein
MNMQKIMIKTGRAFILSIIIITQITVQTSCTGDDNQLAGNTPLTLFAQMDAPATRGTIDNVWDGDEELMVRITDLAASSPKPTENVKFKGSADGKHTPVPGPTYKSWNDYPSGIKAWAWYPDVWAVQTNQNNYANFKKADFIYATVINGINSSNYFTDFAKTLIFKHKTAKVRANLTNGDGISASDLASATVAFYGYTGFNAMDYTDETFNGSISGGRDNDWITPNKKSSTENIYTALLIPQNMAGKSFIRIRIGSQDYYYKPGTGDADLKEGNSYTYNITVKNTGLEVTGYSSATWMGGSSDDVTATEAASIP